MRDTGRVKERYDFTLDSRQIGLVLFAALVAAALLFVLGMSVGRQWERRLIAGRDQASPPYGARAGDVPVEDEVPAAPPVSPASAANKADVPGAGRTGKQDQPEEMETPEAMKPEELTFPKVLTTGGGQAAPRAKETKPAPAKSAKPSKAEGSYTVQVGAFKDRASADTLAGKLRKKGYDSGVYPPAGSKPAKIYRVHVGSFKTKADAQKTAEKLVKSEKLKTYVTSYR